jgi:protoporphyrinogen oxidase
LDIGGGHFLDVKRAAVLGFLFRFMPREEWSEHERIARIRLPGGEVDHPLEANLWQLPLPVELDFLEAISQSGAVRQEPMPRSFEAWIRWKFGKRISEDYMLPYNKKIWSIPLDDLGTYWLDKLPTVSFRETMESCLGRKAVGKLPAHGRFLYPKELTHGYGEVWRRMALGLGDRFIRSCPVREIDPVGKIVNGMFRYDVLITTVPWAIWLDSPRVPKEVREAIEALRFVSIDVDYRSDPPEGAAHWIYEPNIDVSNHRILIRRNFLPGAPGCWTETNALRSPTTVSTSFRNHNRYAYPVNTLNKPAHMQVIMNWATRCNIAPLGRWGSWEHVNSDVAVEQAIGAAEKLLNEN